MNNKINNHLKYFKAFEQILIGLEAGLNVSLYAKPEFDYLQMEQIRLGLIDSLDVSLYAKPEFDGDQMREIREKLLKEKKNNI